MFLLSDQVTSIPSQSPGALSRLPTAVSRTPYLGATSGAIRKALGSASISNQGIPGQCTDIAVANTAIQRLPGRGLQVPELRILHDVRPANAALVAALAQADRARRLWDGLARKTVDQVGAHGRVGPVGTGAGHGVGAAAFVELG